MSTLRKIVKILIVACVIHCNVIFAMNEMGLFQRKLMPVRPESLTNSPPLKLISAEEFGQEYSWPYNEFRESERYLKSNYDDLTVSDLYTKLSEQHNIDNAAAEILKKSNILMHLLQDPEVKTLPIVYVEDLSGDVEQDGNPTSRPIVKRSNQSVKKSPWKRHSSRTRETGEIDNRARYICIPSKKEILNLLAGLYEHRKGDHDMKITFCNRKRPTSTIFTNIRFMD